MKKKSKNFSLFCGPACPRGVGLQIANQREEQENPA